MSKNIVPITASPAPWYELKMAAAGRAHLEIRGTIGLSQEYRDWGLDAAGTVLEFEEELKALGEVSAIDLYIYSLGGSVWDALAIHDILVRHPARIEAHVDGLAASAATIVLMSADTIEVPTNAYLMIHNAAGCVCGDHRAMMKAAEMLRKFSRDIADLYVLRIEGSPAAGEEFDRAATLNRLVKMMDEETWLTGAEAVELGLADTTSAAVEIAADAGGLFADAGWRRTVNLDRVPAALRPVFDSHMESMSKPAPTPAPAPSAPAPTAPTPAPAPAASAEPGSAPAPSEPAPEPQAPAPTPAPAASAEPGSAPAPATPTPAPAATAEPGSAPAPSDVTMEGISALIKGELDPLKEKITNLQAEVDQQKALREAGVSPTAWGGGQAPVPAPASDGGDGPSDYSSMSPAALMSLGRKKMFPSSAA